MESEPPIIQKSLLSDTDTETTKTKTATYEDGISETDQVPTDLAEYHIESTHQFHNDLSDPVPKKGIYPDLESCNENTTYQNENDLNKNQTESSKMGCTSSKESPEELENDLPYTKSKDDDALNQEAPTVCRFKESVELNNPIVSSFSPRHFANSDVDEISDCHRAETEASVAAAMYEGNTSPSHSSAEKHFPGKAVRLEDAYNNEVNEHIRGRKSHDTKEQKGRHGHDKSDDEKTDKTGDKPFRGIDQKWKTNDDDEWEAAHEKFEYFWKSDTIYSQWYYSVFFHEDNKFTCAEQYMMYQKAVLFGDCRIMGKILKTDSPRKMKSLGRKVSGFSEEIWNANCLDIVKQANIAKFSQNRHLKNQLLATYPKILVEASPVDAIWGIGCAEDDPDAWDESTWRGTNYLGYIITEIRDELLVDTKFLQPEEKKVFLPKLKEQMQKVTKKASIHNEETGVKKRCQIPEEGTDVDERFKKSEEENRVKETANSMEEESQLREGDNHLEDGIATKDAVFSIEVGTEAKEDVVGLEVGTKAKEAANSLRNEAEAKETVNNLEDGTDAKERINSSDKGAQSSVAVNDGEGSTEVNEKGDYSGEETHL